MKNQEPSKCYGINETNASETKASKKAAKDRVSEMKIAAY